MTDKPNAHTHAHTHISSRRSKMIKIPIDNVKGKIIKLKGKRKHHETENISKINPGFLRKQNKIYIDRKGSLEGG